MAIPTMSRLGSAQQDSASDGITGAPRALRLGRWSSWTLVTLYVGYAAAIIASGALAGAPKDPYWAIAEVLIIVGAPLQVVLFAVIYETAPVRTKMCGLVALSFMVAMASLTSTVHFIELFVARRIDLAADPALARVVDFSQPSVVFAMDVVAWQFLFGLSLLFAAAVFVGSSREVWIRGGLIIAGLLCLVGLIGPAVGNSYLRSIGAFGYAVVFPVVCVLLGFLYRAASHRPEAA